MIITGRNQAKLHREVETIHALGGANVRGLTASGAQRGAMNEGPETMLA